MKFDWETKKEKILKGAKISAKNKLEGFRLLNELQDKILTKCQKYLRYKLRAGI